MAIKNIFFQIFPSLPPWNAFTADKLRKSAAVRKLIIVYTSHEIINYESSLVVKYLWF
jgi:hypothetical protein